MDRWFDGDYSECYYAWDHVNKTEFILWVWKQDKDYGCPTEEEVEYLWARMDPNDSEKFKIVEYDLLRDTLPITRFRP